MESTDNELQEALAEYAHQAWSGWMKWMFGKCSQQDDGSIIMSAGYHRALVRLMDAPYADLSEGEKDGDRAEADKMMAIMREHDLYDWLEEPIHLLPGKPFTFTPNRTFPTED